MRKEISRCDIPNSHHCSAAFSRRSFLRAASKGMALGVGASVLGVLSGCTSNAGAVLSLYENVLEDKRVIPEADWSYMSDEPTVSLRFVASQGFELVLPALQDAYLKEHANVVIDEPYFVPSAEIGNYLDSEQFDGVFTDLNSVMLAAMKSGIVNEDNRVSLYGSRLQVVGSPDVCEEVAAGADIKEYEPSAIVLGNPDTVYCGVYANQALNYGGLYSTTTGRDGEYDASIADRVEVVGTLDELAERVRTGEKTVGIMMLNEAMVYGFDSLYQIERTRYKTVSFQAAPLEDAPNKMQAQDFIAFCRIETEAEKVADTFGMVLE